MADASITTYQRPYNNVSIASIATTYPAVTTLSTTKPSAGVVHDQQATGMAPSLLRFIPYASATGFTAGVRVVGWAKKEDTTSGDVYWVPTILGEFDLTFSSGAVPTWSLDGATQRPFARAAQVGGTPTANVYSPGTAAGANTEPAAVMIDLAGCQVVTVQFKATSGTPTMGVLFTTL